MLKYLPAQIARRTNAKTSENVASILQYQAVERGRRVAPFDLSKGGLSNLQTQKTRSWAKDTLLGNMVKKIAKEHGMAPAVMDVLAKIALPHIDQADESDLHFLGRVVKKYDAIVKPAAGKLVLAKVRSAKTISGLALPSVTLGPDDVSRFRVVIRSELDRRERRKVSVSVTLPSRTDLVAEGRMILAGFRDGVDGEWSITRAEHSMDEGGFTTTLEAEQPNISVIPDTVDEML